MILIILLVLGISHGIFISMRSQLDHLKMPMFSWNSHTISGHFVSLIALLLNESPPSPIVRNSMQNNQKLCKVIPVSLYSRRTLPRTFTRDAPRRGSISFVCCIMHDEMHWHSVCVQCNSFSHSFTLVVVYVRGKTSYVVSEREREMGGLPLATLWH